MGEKETEINVGEVFTTSAEEQEDLLKQLRKEIWDYWEIQVILNEHERMKPHLIRHGGIGKRNLEIYQDRNKSRLILSKMIQSLHRDGMDFEELFEILPVLSREEISSLFKNEA